MRGDSKTTCWIRARGRTVAIPRVMRSNGDPVDRTRFIVMDFTKLNRSWWSRDEGELDYWIINEPRRSVYQLLLVHR